jgi:NTE family protein
MPDLKGVQGSDFGRSEDLIQRGYAEAAAHAADLLPYALAPEAYDAWSSARQVRRPESKVLPARVVVEGVDPVEAARITRRLSAHAGRPLDADALDRDLILLTGSGRYESATYRIDDSRGPSDLVVALRKPSHGPPFLAMALDLQNTQSSTIAATVRGRLLLFDLVGRGSESRVDIALGNTLAGAAEIYRPLGRTGLFVAPRVFAQQKDTPLFKDDAYTAEYREYHAGASLDVGFATASRLETRLGYTADHYRRDPVIGDPELPSVNGPQRFASARLVFDGQDGPTIPTRGLYLKADLRQFFEVPDVITDAGSQAADPDNLVSGQVEFSLFRPVGRRGRVFVRGTGGSSFGDTTVVNAFSLGGPFDLGAYYPNELRGSNFVVANVGYFHEVGRLAEGALGRLYFGSWIDEGSAFEASASARFHTNITAGFVLESPIGPMFAGTSIGADGRYRVYFSLGPVIR